MTNADTVFSVCNNAAVRRAARRLGQLYDDVLEPSGLRTTQFTLLTQIKRMGSPSPRELADMLVMDLSAMGHTLRLLTREGLVDLEPDPTDRRAKRVSLTPAGLKKQRESAKLWQEAQSRFDASFGKAKSRALRETLNLISSDDFAAHFVEKPRAAKQPAS